MNLSGDWVSALRAADIDAVNWAAIGPQDAADEAIMAWAQANDAVVLTRDLDFAATLVLLRLDSPSIIQLRIDQARPDRHVPLVKRALSFHHTRLERGAIVTIEEDRVRVRALDPDD